MRKLFYTIILIFLLIACVKDNPKVMTRDLYKAEEWQIASIEIIEKRSNTGWADDWYVSDEINLNNAGYIYFYDTEGVNPTYRKGSFELQGAEPIAFEWDCSGAPGTDDVPDLYLILQKEWRDFPSQTDILLNISSWSDSELLFDIGYQVSCEGTAYCYRHYYFRIATEQ